MPFDQILMSEDSLEDWRNFTPGYVEQIQSGKTAAGDDDDYIGESAEEEEQDDSMSDRVSQQENPLLEFIKKP